MKNGIAPYNFSGKICGRKRKKGKEKRMENDYVKLKDVGTKVEIQDVKFTICCILL